MLQRFLRSNRGSLDTSRSFYMFISPWLLGFLLFTLLPMLYSFYASLTKWNAMSTPVFVGLENFINIFTNDRRFIGSLLATLYYAGITVPLNLILALALAVVLNKRLPGTMFFRSVFYLPNVISSVAVFVTWTYLLKTNGYINIMLSWVGIIGPDWLNSRTWSMPALILMNTSTAGGAMLILLAGLQGVPRTYYEAAKIDGAGGVRTFFSITLPLLTPVILFNLITGIIGAFQMFAQAYTMTKGGPANSTYVFALYIYDKAFNYSDMGYASALAVILFIATLVFGLLLLGSSKKWVHYSQEVS